jgi:hypothetical protein
VPTDPSDEVAAAADTAGGLPVTGRDLWLLVALAVACLLVGTALRSVGARATEDR